jgi:hypothetical protein
MVTRSQLRRFLRTLAILSDGLGTPQTCPILRLTVLDHVDAHVGAHRENGDLAGEDATISPLSGRFCV